MKTIKTLLILLLATGIAIQAGKAQDPEKYEVSIPLSNPGEPGVLECHLLSGSITVTGYDGEIVMIEASAKTRKVEEEDDEEEEGDMEPKPGTEGLRKISSTGSFNLSAEENDNRVEISSSSWKQGINLAIRVPVNFSLEIGTTNNGDIAVENIHGNHEIRNINGSITLERISGSVLANTVNDDIIVKFETVEEGTPMSFSSLTPAAPV